MTATELVQLIVNWAFVLIAVLTLVDYLRAPSQARLDINLMFGALATVILISGASRALNLQYPWLGYVLLAVLLTQPYLLLRLAGHFRPLSRRVHLLALGGLALSLVVVLLPATRAVPPGVAIVALVYFVLVESYATLQFARIARQAAGTLRRRTFFAASGSGWLAGAILLLLFASVLPGVATALSEVASVLSVVSYYLAFAPPKALRRAWQLAELHHFLRAAASREIEKRLDGSLDHLCPAVTRTIGGSASAVFLRAGSEDDEQLVLTATDRPGWQAPPQTLTQGALARSFQTQAAVETSNPGEMGPGLAALAAEAAARSVLAAPIGVGGRQWGVLAVFRAHAGLFPGDDSDVLQLFADHAAEVLESGELVKQQKVLLAKVEAANKELEAFSYSVSHDLRAPLRAMNGFSQVLLQDHLAELSEPAQHYVRRIQNNAERMGNLVDDLLALSRYGRQTLKLKPVDLAAVARQAWDDLRLDHENRAVAFEVQNLPSALADAALLKQVYINLLSNALKFTRQQPEARITVGCRDDGSGPVYFVRDNGVGFDMAYANKLFGVFQRLHRSEDFEGTGVGLAIVQRVVERHGGRVSAESAPGQGASFFFTLKGA